MKRTIRTYAALGLSLAAASLLATCSSDTRSPTEIVANARQIRAVSGDAQSGRALAPLRDPLSVQVLDNEGNPVPAFTVRFEVTSSQGVFAGSNQRSTEVVTNSSGLTSVYLDPGRLGGHRVRCPGLSRTSRRRTPAGLARAVQRPCHLIGGYHRWRGRRWWWRRRRAGHIFRVQYDRDRAGSGYPRRGGTVLQNPAGRARGGFRWARGSAA